MILQTQSAAVIHSRLPTCPAACHRFISTCRAFIASHIENWCVLYCLVPSLIGIFMVEKDRNDEHCRCNFFKKRIWNSRSICDATAHCAQIERVHTGRTRAPPGNQRLHDRSVGAGRPAGELWSTPQAMQYFRCVDSVPDWIKRPGCRSQSCDFYWEITTCFVINLYQKKSYR